MGCSPDAEIAYGIPLLGAWEDLKTNKGWGLGEEFEGRYEDFEDVVAHALGWTPDENGQPYSWEFYKTQLVRVNHFGCFHDETDQALIIAPTLVSTSWDGPADISALIRGAGAPGEPAPPNYAFWGEMLAHVVHKLDLTNPETYKPHWMLMASYG